MKAWLRDVSLSKKLAVLGCVGVVLFLVPFVPYVLSTNEAIRIAQLEQRGAPPAQALMRVIQLSQQHRGLSAALLGGNASVCDARGAKQKEVEQAYESMSAVVRQDIGEEKLSATWQKAAAEWNSIKTAVASGSITAKESNVRHTDLIAQQLHILDLLADYYGLSLDPNFDSYFLIMATVVHMPQLTEALGQSRARGTAYLSAKTLNNADQTTIAVPM